MLKSQKGVGLIEIVIAMLVFAIGISAALRALPDSNVATTHARNISIAANLAQEQIEILSGTPYNGADLTAGNHVDPRNPLQRHFTRTWTVADNVPVSGMKQVSVTVSFNSVKADSSVILNTYLTSRR